ncbi:MAG: T9SS type A sorting domain-containing protein [Saprospiraceae bacterium]|nr:T9SS type A sorting domain-containing protein [Saprospiraceae bacterium]
MTVEVSSEKGIGEVTFEVVNLTGSLIYTRKVAAQDEFMTTTLPTKALPAGTYFIKILNGSNVWQHKFIKQ